VILETHNDCIVNNTGADGKGGCLWCMAGASRGLVFLRIWRVLLFILFKCGAHVYIYFLECLGLVCCVHGIIHSVLS
jgi:hypothetical protein